MLHRVPHNITGNAFRRARGSSHARQSRFYVEIAKVSAEFPLRSKLIAHHREDLTAFSYTDVRIEHPGSRRRRTIRQSSFAFSGRD